MLGPKQQLLEHPHSQKQPPIATPPPPHPSPINISLSPNSRLSESSTKGKYTGCNCCKSQCLKMYCACFSVGKMCDETCLCESCKNCTDNMDRSEAICEVIERDPHAFSRKSPSQELSKATCNCLKSACLKKYCDCFRSGKQCGATCQCKGCKNNENEEDIPQSKPVKVVKLE